ncbi:MAG: hypothetical protein M3454_02395 [Actinomycetota bacterium]|nr:hypothetical protein [Actinomycetota bacterium]
MATASIPRVLSNPENGGTAVQRLPLNIRYQSLVVNCWRVLVATTLGLFALSVPARYAELEAVAEAAERNHPGLLSGFWGTISAPGAYPGIVLSLEVTFVVGLALASAGIAVGGRADWRNLFFSAVFVTYSVWVTPTLDALSGGPLLRHAASMVQATGLIFAIHFFLLFPDGRFVPRWTRVSSAFWIVYTLAWGVQPDAWYSLIDPFEVPLLIFAALMTGWITGLIAQLTRYRRNASSQQCAQTKWVILAVAGAVAGYGTVYLPGVFIAETGAARVAFDLFHVPVFWVLAMPISFALCISMLRYHLFDFPTAINRTLVYASLTTTLALTYIGMVTLLGQILHSLAGSSNLAIAGSTLTVSALFRPARSRIQEVIDRRFYRKRYDAAQALDTFTTRLREEIDLASLETELLALVNQTMQPTHASLWLLRPADGDRRVVDR